MKISATVNMAVHLVKRVGAYTGHICKVVRTTSARCQALSGQRSQKQKCNFFLCRGRERSKSADVRTSPTLTTQGDTGPSQYSRHPPPTMHHASPRKPPEAPHSAWPTLPHPAPRRPAADRTRGGAPGRQRRRHRSPARAAAPPGRRSRSRTSWSSAGATARMQRRSELRPVSHTNAGVGGGPQGMGCEGGARK